MSISFDTVIIGGLGHVGLPLGLAFAAKGLNVALYDINEEVADTVRSGKMPFVEHGAEPLLRNALSQNRLTISSSALVIGQAQSVIVAVGTPVDRYLNPKTREFLSVFHEFRKQLRPEQTIIIRSTVYPNTCRQLVKHLAADGKRWHVAYCPERIAQGYAIQELAELPQLVSGLSQKAVDDAKTLFGKIAPKLIEVSIEEAEFAKLFSNAWRYIQFAVANQFYMIANNFGVDFNRVRKVMMEGYGRAATVPAAGFAAGPCLLKDTMQLAAFNNNNFLLGHAAMMVNEALPNFIVEQLRRNFSLDGLRVGILGMAFKADIDDIRDSLSYKLEKILHFHGATVLRSDEFVRDVGFVPKEELCARADVIVVGAPHSTYRALAIPTGKALIDPWGIIACRTAGDF